MLFHYNGHGVPRPTANGEVWVFNKSYTQYIPLSVFDLQARCSLLPKAVHSVVLEQNIYPVMPGSSTHWSL